MSSKARDPEIVAKNAAGELAVLLRGAVESELPAGKSLDEWRARHLLATDLLTALVGQPNVWKRQAQIECIIYGLACNTKLGPEPCIRVKLFGLPPAISNCTKNPSGAPSRPKRLAATGTSV